MKCSNDPAAGDVCEYTCATTADCPDWTTVCVGGSCILDVCGPGTGNGTFDGPCNAAGSNDGTCFPLDNSGDGGTALVGVCQQAGTIATPDATCYYVRCAASDLCAAGWGCVVPNQVAPTGTCLQFCNPSSATNNCPAGRHCSAYPGSTDFGGCLLPDGGA